MADRKLSGSTELTGSLASGDLLYIVDVSDTTDGAGGTTKKYLASSLSAQTETMTNKTLTAPVIATISNSGTVTLPTGTRTLVARDTTDTLTNKTLTNPISTSQTLTDAATVTVDCSLGQFMTLTTGGNRTMGAATNQKVGGLYSIKVINGGTSNTLAWNANYLFVGTDPVLGVGANAVSLFLFISDGTNMMSAGYSLILA